jgi:uncharacterized membrane protein SpoIIM required for sporulation
MDLDRFLTANRPAWDRLDALTRRGGRLAPAELDELVTLYQRTSTHLSLARSRYREPALTVALTALTARAGSYIYGTRPRTLRAVGRFFTQSFPAALWHSRWFVAVSTVLFLLPALGIGIWIAGSERALEASAPAALREAYVNTDFEDYYSSDPSAQFAADVTTNNIQVGFLAFAGGVLLCVPTAYLLLLNGANLGFAGGLFGAAEQLPRFFGLLLPHGLLELTAVFIAGAAGLRLGWTLIDPGDRPRADALVEEGRRAVVIVIGLVVMFSVAGLIEGFVTGSPLPTWARLAVGIVAEVSFLTYAVVLGRAAASHGLTGALGETDRGGWSADRG